MKPLSTNASLQWQEDGTPVSCQFDDVYFSRGNGLAESDYVFVQQNQLPSRWQALKPGQHFTIAETGFGTGLNFLLACQYWLELTAEQSQLTFISVEKYPLKVTEISQALAAWPQLQALSRQLIDQYPPLLEGCHCLDLIPGRIRLLLCLGDATEQFQALFASEHPDFEADPERQVDAWFLDGFAPSKNPDMWQPELFSAIAKLSRTGTSFATFTAAGLVKRGLQSQGFQVNKCKGYGKKRDMLVGHYQGLPSCPELPTRSEQRNRKITPPWFIPPAKPAHSEKQALIIGAGLAGCTSAFSLAQCGWQVTVVDQHSKPAQEASGNPQGVLYAKLALQSNPLSDFALQSYIYAQGFYRQLQQQGLLQDGEDLDFCGVLQLAFNNEEQQRLGALEQQLSDFPNWFRFLTADQASQLAGISLTHPATYFPQSGWIAPTALCQQLLKHPHIELQQGQASGLRRDADHWYVDFSDRASMKSPVVIVANSYNAQALLPDLQLSLNRIRGQITQLPVAPAKTLNRTVICHEGYLSPAKNGQLCFGATYDLTSTTNHISQEDHEKNWQQLQHHLPALAEQLNFDTERLSGRSAFRCTSNDYLPVIGPAPNAEQFCQDYQLLSTNRKAYIPRRGCFQPGLYLNIGHGSRGLTSTPLAATLITAMLEGQNLPVAREMLKALSPARFLVKQLIRKNR